MERVDRKIVLSGDAWRKEHTGAETPTINGWYKVLTKKTVIDFNEKGEKIGYHYELSNSTWLYRDGWYGQDVDFRSKTPFHCAPPEWWTSQKMIDDEPLDRVNLEGMTLLNEQLLKDWRKEYTAAYRCWLNAWHEEAAREKVKSLELEITKGYLSALVDDGDAIIRTLRREIEDGRKKNGYNNK